VFNKIQNKLRIISKNILKLKKQFIEELRIKPKFLNFLNII